MEILSKLREHLTTSPEEQAAPKIREWCDAVPGAERISKCRPRSHQKVAGVVESIKLVPSNHTCLLEVQIYDGSDEIRGVWYGRRKIPGVDLGRRISLEGTVCQDNAGLQIINPAYELLPA